MRNKTSGSNEDIIYSQIVDEEQRQVTFNKLKFVPNNFHILSVLSVVFLLLGLWNSKRTIVSVEKQNNLNGTRSGLEITYRPFQSETTLSIWSARSALNYTILGSPYVKRVVHQNWLSNNSAVHLVMEIGYEESGHPATAKAQIIYDFRRAELFTLCDLPLWRSYNLSGGPIDRGWLTENEFEAVLLRLQRNS